jgi:hypothetical protein
MRTACFLVVGWLFVAADAHASEPDQALATDDGHEEWLRDLDFRGAVRLGAGYSSIFHAPVTSTSFEDEFSMFRLGTNARFHVLFGMSSYSAGEFLRGDPSHRSFFSATVGAGLNFYVGRPLFSVSATTGPGWSGTNDGFVPDGIGIGGRLAMFPFYRNIMTDLNCEGGWARTYLLSGLSVWGEARQDFFGANSGTMLAAGGGIDLARHVLLPIIHHIFTGHCGLE